MDFRFWLNLVLRPQETLQPLKAPSDWWSAFKVWAVTGMLAAVALGLAGFLTTGFSGLALVVLLFSVLFNAILYPIIYALGEGIHFLVARLLGGTGSFRDQYYFVGLSGRPIIPLVSFFMGVAPQSPFFFLCLFAAVLLSMLWKYPQTVVYRKVHGFGWFKAILVWFIPGLVLVLLSLLLVFLFFGIVLAAAASAGALNATSLNATA